MRPFIRLIVLFAPFALAGCISYTSSRPAHTTVVAPPGSTATCGAAGTPPC